ncbi:MAG TPA: hypothetical protein ENI86_07755 [Acidimicrobiales bacterium]|nr:hypothetical protein [Acidimicrobiales bacterium]
MGPIDGVFGEHTRSVVRGFQADSGLDSDGICGPDTWASLIEAAHVRGSRLLYMQSPPMRGEDVAQLQRDLAALGFPAGPANGIFADRTARATAEFQRNVGLVPDGVVGPETLRALERLGRRGFPTESVVHVLQEQQYLLSSGSLGAMKIVIGENGGMNTLAAAVRRSLSDNGAHVIVTADPDWSNQAAQANKFGAELFIGLQARPDRREICYFRSQNSVSVGGRHLAALVAERVSPLLGPISTTGMRIAILRETRMPAVLCRLGSADRLVPANAGVASAVAASVRCWTEQSRGA